MSDEQEDDIIVVSFIPFCDVTILKGTAANLSEKCLGCHIGNETHNNHANNGTLCKDTTDIIPLINCKLCNASSIHAALVLLILMGAVTTILNFWSAVVWFSTRKLVTPQLSIKKLLTLTNLGVGIIVVPYSIGNCVNLMYMPHSEYYTHDVFTTDDWINHFMWNGNALSGAIMASGAYGQILCIFFLTLDKYIAIAHPWRYKKFGTKRVEYIYTAVTCAGMFGIGLATGLTLPFRMDGKFGWHVFSVLPEPSLFEIVFCAPLTIGIITTLILMVLTAHSIAIAERRSSARCCSDSRDKRSTTSECGVSTNSHPSEGPSENHGTTGSCLCTHELSNTCDKTKKLLLLSQGTKIYPNKKLTEHQRAFNSVVIVLVSYAVQILPMFLAHSKRLYSEYDVLSGPRRTTVGVVHVVTSFLFLSCSITTAIIFNFRNPGYVKASKDLRAKVKTKISKIRNIK